MFNKGGFNVLEYTYYTVTLFYSKYESKYGFEDNKITGAYTIGLIIGFNIISILFIVLALSIERSPTLDSIAFPIIASIIIISNFYSLYFFRKKHHKYIFEKYQNENKKQKWLRNTYVAIYIVFSIALLFLGVYIGRENWMIKS